MTYDQLGRHARKSILEVLPSEWSFHEKRVLDFGCGAGRTLRHFFPEAAQCDFWGCDIDTDSVEWLKAALCPPFHVFQNRELPPLELESESLDLVYAVSVFTHLTDSWSTWLLEMHRILASEGLLLATFIGPGAAPHVTDEPWTADLIGMNVLRPGQGWDLGGPMVLHSPWWIRAHWGRAFEILHIELDGFGADSPGGHGVVLMRKRPARLTTQDLEVPEPNEPRELGAARSNLRELSTELTRLRAEFEELSAAWRGERAEKEALRSRSSELESAIQLIANSHSWRLTAPLRALRNRFGGDRLASPDG
jgi:SAM-dependent methyltransferase